MVTNISRATPTESDSPLGSRLEQLATPVSYAAMSDGNLLSLSYDENIDMSEFMQSPHSLSQRPEEGPLRTPTDYAESHADRPPSADEVHRMSGQSRVTPFTGTAEEDPSLSTFGRQFTATGYIFRTYHTQ